MAALRQWKDATQQMKDREKVERYLRYKGTTRLDVFLQNWMKKQYAVGWYKWLDETKRQQQEERQYLEQFSAGLIGRVCRGHVIRCKVLNRIDMYQRKDKLRILINFSSASFFPNKLKRHALEKLHHLAASNIARVFRGFLTR